MSKPLAIDWDSACLSLLVFTALTVVDDLTRAIRQNTAARQEANAALQSIPDAVRLQMTPKE